MKRSGLEILRFAEIIRLSRPSLWVLTALPFAAGYLLTRPDPSLSLSFWLGLLYFTLPYNLLINGLDNLAGPGSKERRWLLGWILAANLPLLLILTIVATPGARLWLPALILAALAYSLKSLRLKHIPLIDALTWSFLLAGVLMYGMLLGKWQTDLLPLAASFFLWGAGASVFGRIRTYGSDRAASLSGTATFMGIQKSAYASLLLFTAAPIVVFIFYDGRIKFLITLMFLYVLNVARFTSVKNSELFEMGWRFFLKLNYIISGILLVLLIIYLK